MMQTQTKIDAEKILETFLAMVRLDSPSGQEGPVREYIATRLEQLGVSYTVDEAGNIIAKIPGFQNQSGMTLILTGHMDVVPPCIGIEPLVEGHGDSRIIRSAGNTVLGADDKSGLAAMLEALALSLEHNLPRPNLLLLITTREEVSLQGAKNMDPAQYRDADFAIAFDHTGKQGTMIYEAPTYIQFKIAIHGKSVHAGIMPEQGVNAIQILSWVLEKLRFGRLDANTTANLGFIQGGKATNIVPDCAVAEGELRGHDDKRLQEELTHIQYVLNEIVTPIKGASYTFETEIGFQHYLTPPEDPRVQRVMKAAEALGLPINLIRTNGGSDVNVFALNGVPGIVLSAGYMEPHSLNERVPLQDMVTCTAFILSICEAFAQP